MNDLISRQAAIELIENESRKWGDEYGVSDVLCDLADLPAAQPEKRTNKSTETHACDCISRQAAIDYCHRLINTEHQQGSDEMNYGQERVNQTETILYHLEVMPSAQPEQPERCSDCEWWTNQPEIIRCKDCKHFHYDMPYVVQGIPILGHEVCDFWGDGCKTNENGFCSYAERREE